LLQKKKNSPNSLAAVAFIYCQLHLHSLKNNVT